MTESARPSILKFASALAVAEGLVAWLVGNSVYSLINGLVLGFLTWLISSTIFRFFLLPMFATKLPNPKNVTQLTRQLAIAALLVAFWTGWKLGNFTIQQGNTPFWVWR